jgi:predicted RNA-binding Zn-ribbon protein involved in translation (DUF1610 family)
MTWCERDHGHLTDVTCPSCGRASYLRKFSPNAFMGPLKCNGCGQEIADCWCPHIPAVVA